MMVVVLVAMAENVKMGINNPWIKLLHLKNLAYLFKFQIKILELVKQCDCQACYHIILKVMYVDCKVLALLPFAMRKHRL